MANVFLLSLGCPKNLVDSEDLLRKLGEQGLTHSPVADDADILVVNTCGFVEEAKRESIEEILRIAAAKKPGKRLLVYGCLAKRFGGELKREIPEIDAIWGVGEDDDIVRYCGALAQSGPPMRRKLASPRLLSDKPYAYLKIAEGCDRGCSYCVIPKIRGKFRSRRTADIVREARGLLRSGVKELILVAQDVTSYGRDSGDYDLSGLLSEIASLKGDFWIRLLYLYPTSIDDRLLETIAGEEKICKYIDMPLQHSEDRILALMGRGGGSVHYEKLISRIRARIPGVAIRTTFIVGFPQETDEESEELAAFVKRMEFDRMGAFTYSREQGTKAYGLKGQVSGRKKKERYGRLMEVQSSIAFSGNRGLLGKTFKALVDEVDDGVAVARIYSQAPEIDGVVFLREEGIEKGSFVRVKITDAFGYDLEGKIVR